MKQLFISCDWGTSSFRIRLVNAATHSVLAEMNSDDGILKTHTAWAQQRAAAESRLGFYRNILSAGISSLQSQVADQLALLPIIVSGMASANIGMKELPYKELPVFVDGTNLLIETIPADQSFVHDILLVSGVRTKNDVMRGEETQLAGALKDSRTEQLVIFPGTHSKHIHIADGLIQNITTYMTGEFLELLSRKSILAGSVEPHTGLTEPANKEAFRQGVEAGRDHSLLHSSFMVRTNALFGSLSKTANYDYLCGLLIGTELKEQASIHLPLTIVADTYKQTAYALAAEILGLEQTGLVNIDEAVRDGHIAIYKSLFSSKKV
jgi:2-dehydro-3-deoxygalactonokinase